MKSKKILTILLSLAIMFTFMPAMAFAAAGAGTWDTTSYNSVTVDGKTYTSIAKTWNAGVVGADINWADYTGLDSSAVGSQYVEYYDLDNSEIGVTGTWTHDAFAQALAAKQADGKGELADSYETVKTFKPAYIKTGAADTNKYQVLPSSVASVKVYATGFDPNNLGVQTVTLTATVIPAGVDSASVANAAKLVGSVPTKTVTVEGRKGQISDVKFAVDDLGKYTTDPGKELEANYDGKKHTVVNNTVEGITVAYKLQDETTKKYEAVEAVEFTNAGDYNFAAVLTDTNTKATQTKYFTATVKASKNGEFYFDWDSSVTTTNTVAGHMYAVLPQDADPADYIVVKDIHSADKEEAMKYFNEKYEVKATPNKANPKYSDWSVEAKDVKDSDLTKKYKTLFKNYGFNTTSDYALWNGSDVTVELSAAANDKEDDITFSGVTTKSFKAKKKTKKLAKAKSFQVAAVADSGNEITFTGTSTNAKIKISKTGKVTVKKGLKKGTYKITVKAKTAAGNGYKACKESKTFTIKIK